MKKRFMLITVLAGACSVSALLEARAGVILIATRKNQDTMYSSEHTSEEKGPGLTTPGDIAMAQLLGDHGYSCRVLLDALLNDNLGGSQATYLNPVDENMKIDLVIWSGSSASADVPAPPAGVPLLMGEHVTLGNREDRVGSIFMYNGQNSNDPNESSSPPASKYMTIVATNHPIVQGIPLDAEGRVKIFREPYPDENAHVPMGGKANFEYRWCTQAVADAAPGTTILGVLDGAEDRACFAAVDKGGQLANGEAASARMVQMFTNEDGSGGARRVFLALTPWGRLLFARAVQWALGEELQPYQPLRILDVTAEAAAGKVTLTWPGSIHSNYQIHASADAMAWQPVAIDIPGAAGTITRTLDVSAAPSAVFFQVAALP